MRWVAPTEKDTANETPNARFDYLLQLPERENIGRQ
jgi:hypothetical protein